MAASNQLRTSAKVIKKAGMPTSASPQEKTTSSALDRVGISSAMALQGKKIKNLSLKSVSNY